MSPHVFNMSLQEGVVPFEWKEANIIPLFKKGSRNESVNSCLTNLLCFLEEITKWADDGSPVNVIYLDFQKAFDKVPHQRLIRK